MTENTESIIVRRLALGEYCVYLGGVGAAICRTFADALSLAHEFMGGVQPNVEA